mmetsp:Transcript_6921/g.20211  ORF Transcript_6921/g.20211 Transcript_6921/m.20211 type:complete len:206 (-) Transcript_6921:1597-2214(-)
MSSLMFSAASASAPRESWPWNLSRSVSLMALQLSSAATTRRGRFIVVRLDLSTVNAALSRCATLSASVENSATSTTRWWKSSARAMALMSVVRKTRLRRQRASASAVGRCRSLQAQMTPKSLSMCKSSPPFSGSKRNGVPVYTTQMNAILWKSLWLASMASWSSVMMPCSPKVSTISSSGSARRWKFCSAPMSGAANLAMSPSKP